ncbi:MAG: alanine--tRNA ligase [Verrucomicrobia bacterium]|nr:alanine--tRNA ligase [Verrucomicrobiota bacterium]
MTSSEIRQSFLDFFKSKQHSMASSSSLMPDAPNLLFTNAGMNQFVPIFLGQEKCPYQPGRAADTQKCIRAGGKHNDLEDVGMDTYHHTFFEMLGNWSFGDYFKKEAIEWAWELLTEVWKFPKERVYATVYKPDASKGDPAEFDQDAYDLWFDIFKAAGLDPEVHIVYGNKKDNFWMMGDTGPCGPCSELHIDLTPNADTKGALVNTDSADCIEIWNLVFIQFNANPDGTFSDLPAKHVDTGMGFERVASVMQNTRGFTEFNHVISNYETDVFRPIFDHLEKMSGKKYASTLPEAGHTTYTEQEKIDIAFRVIADHIRTLGFSIADGIAPGNTDRNYVLRRILRRAVRYGRALDFHEPFFFQLVDVIAETMGDVFPELRERKTIIQDTIRAEETAFNKTLDRGIQLFTEKADTLSSGEELGGAFAFKLYDTFGFPLDLTELMARERGLTVDSPGFETHMEAQRQRARAAQQQEVISVSQIKTTQPTKFLGFDQLQTEAKVLEVVQEKDALAVVLDSTVFYAEMGGQLGDQGSLTRGGQLWQIQDTRKAGDAWLHMLPIKDGSDTDEIPGLGQSVMLEVNLERRNAIQRHHTVTHLLHWALHEVVGKDVSQKGSYVGPEKLTFDFNSQPLTPEQVRDVEQLVNQRILENGSVSWQEVPYEEVQKRSDIMQFFGDKYGDKVRVVQIGGGRGNLDGYSMELCGGTHASATGEIGLFRIVAESAIAAGIRRIEACAGMEAYQRALHESKTLQAMASQLNTPLGELDRKIESILVQQKQQEKELRLLREKQASGTANQLKQTAINIPASGDLAECPLILANLGEVEGNTIQTTGDALKSGFDGVIVLVGKSGDSAVLLAITSKEWQKAYPAGKIIQTLAPLVDGRGGGKPAFARGGGKAPGNLEDLIKQAPALIANLS